MFNNPKTYDLEKAQADAELLRKRLDAALEYIAQNGSGYMTLKKRNHLARLLAFAMTGTEPDRPDFDGD